MLARAGGRGAAAALSLAIVATVVGGGVVIRHRELVDVAGGSGYPDTVVGYAKPGLLRSQMTSALTRCAAASTGDLPKISRVRRPHGTPTLTVHRLLTMHVSFVVAYSDQPSDPDRRPDRLVVCLQRSGLFMSVSRWGG